MLLTSLQALDEARVRNGVLPVPAALIVDGLVVAALEGQTVGADLLNAEVVTRASIMN